MGESGFISEKCILCEYPANKEEEGALSQKVVYNCPNCGVFSVGDEFAQYAELDKIPLHLFSGYIRERQELNQPDYMITYEGWKPILESRFVPANLSEKLVKLLAYYQRRSAFF